MGKTSHMDESQVMVQMKDIVKKFGNFTANDHINLTVHKGEVHAILGENGSTLSGGERQRISIARALLKDSPIILLDEATASLDPENEVFVQKALAHLIKGKTVIMIAHRLSTVVGADKIIILEEGHIVEQGTHAELTASGGLYARMWTDYNKAVQWKITSEKEAE